MTAIGSSRGKTLTCWTDAKVCFFEEEETAACVDEGHRHGKRLCSHARCACPVSSLVPTSMY